MPASPSIPATAKNDADVQVHAGVAYSPDGRLLYDATGDSGAVDVWSTDNWQRVGRIDLNGPTAGVSYAESFSANLTLDRDGRVSLCDRSGQLARGGDRYPTRGSGWLLFPPALIHWRWRFRKMESGYILPIPGCSSIKLIDGARKDDMLNTGLHFPPFGYPSNNARRGVRAEGQRSRARERERCPRQFALDVRY